MNEKVKDILLAFSTPAMYVLLVFYNWYIQRVLEIDEYNADNQMKELVEHFMAVCEDNLWLMVTLSLMLNYWIVQLLLFTIDLIF